MDELRIVSLLTQLGSFGLLSFIAVMGMRWLPKRVEKWDQNAAAERASRERVAELHKEAVVGLTAVFAEEVKYEREACERRHAEALRAAQENHLILREISHELRGMAQQAANERAARKQQEKAQRGS